MSPEGPYRRSQILEMFQIEGELIDALERADLIRPTQPSRSDRTGEDACYDPVHVDRIRVAVALTRELDMDLHATEIILRLRERIFAMENQMRQILERVARDLRER